MRDFLWILAGLERFKKCCGPRASRTGRRCEGRGRAATRPYLMWPIQKVYVCWQGNGGKGI